jgi:hypothetical protein
VGARLLTGLHSRTAGAAYVKLIVDEGKERIRCTTRDTYDPLVEVKTHHPPDDLRRVNQNIRPSGR